MMDILKSNFALLVGLGGLIVVAYNLYLRRKIHTEDSHRRQKQHDQELEFQQKKHMQEMEFQQKKLLVEEEAHKERERWLRQQSVRITQVSEELASKIALQLQQNYKWASDALEKAKLKAPAQTLFAERLEHFHDEKEFIADHFVPLLMQRCKLLIQSGKRVHLIIDSGTTLYPLFQRLGRACVRVRENGETWLDKLSLWTNNLPGMEALIEHGRLNPNNRYSRIAINSNLFPGIPIPIFSALAGEETIKAIDHLRDKASADDFFISIVTGNWLRLRRSVPNCPVPLARGLEHTEHLAYKQALIDIANEAYMVAPLGKLFVDVAKEDVNNVLKLSDTSPDPDRRAYKELEISDEKASHIKIVSTSRMDDHVLTKLSTRVQVLLNVNDQGIKGFDSVPCHLLFPFNNLPSSWFLELEVEFPHAQTRDDEFRQKYFFVPASKPNGRQ